jgi:hypothetical protein
MTNQFVLTNYLTKNLKLTNYLTKNLTLPNFLTKIILQIILRNTIFSTTNEHKKA